MTIVISRIPRNSYQGKVKDKFRVLYFHDLEDPMNHVGEVFFVEKSCWYGLYWIVPFVRKAGLYISDGKWRRMKKF